MYTSTHIPVCFVHKLMELCTDIWFVSIWVYEDLFQFPSHLWNLESLATSLNKKNKKKNTKNPGQCSCSNLKTRIWTKIINISSSQNSIFSCVKKRVNLIEMLGSFSRNHPCLFEPLKAKQLYNRKQLCWSKTILCYDAGGKEESNHFSSEVFQFQVSHFKSHSKKTEGLHSAFKLNSRAQALHNISIEQPSVDQTSSC